MYPGQKIEMKLIDNGGSLKAVADIILEGGIEVRGFKITVTEDGRRWVNPPSSCYERSDGEKVYRDTIRWQSRDRWRRVEAFILEAYDRCVEVQSSLKGTEQDAPY